MFEQTDPNQIQLTSDGELKHFITTEGLSREILTDILDRADSFVDMSEKQVKKVFACNFSKNKYFCLNPKSCEQAWL